MLFRSQQRGSNEDLIEEVIADEKEKEDIKRAAYEAELREKLRAELLADLAKQNAEKSDNGDNTEK